MRSITQLQDPTNKPKFQAQEIALANGFNCYSKLWNNEKRDFETDREAVFYFQWRGEVLEVILQKEPAQDYITPDPENFLFNQPNF